MSSFKSRSDYFKNIAYLNKLIAHNRPVLPGSDLMRKSFHRLNDQDEFDGAVREWGHYPCVVHMGHTVRFKKAGNGLPHRVTENGLRFLDKIDTSLYPNTADAMEVAYDRAFAALLQFLSRMLEDAENDSCFSFDIDKATADQTGLIVDSVCGWDVFFFDENRESGLRYSEDSWFDEDGSDGGSGSNNPDSVTLYYTDESQMEIPWTDDLRNRFGYAPRIEVFYTETNEFTGAKKYLKDTLPLISPDAPPPGITKFTVELKAPGPGYITISN